MNWRPDQWRMPPSAHGGPSIVSRKAAKPLRGAVPVEIEQLATIALDCGFTVHGALLGVRARHVTGT
jgi:hypothetical protein